MASRASGLIALLSSLVPTSVVGVRIHPLPDNIDGTPISYPFITIIEGNASKLLSLTGPVGNTDSWFQINVWSNDYEQAAVCRELVKDILDSYAGVAGTRVIDSSDHILDTELYDGDRELHQLITRYHIWWED